MATAKWPVVADLPPLHRRDGSPLPANEIDALLQLLSNDIPAPVYGTLENPHPLQPWCRDTLPATVQTSLAALRERSDELALDGWMAALLGSWLRDIGTGTARKIRWVVPAAANLGGDACAALLGPHLRGENYDLRCTGEVGVAALVEIGTRGALLELAHLARKFPAKMRGQTAQRALQDIAATRGLTPEQLQDRILPACGLDDAGRRSFDYGPRQFELVLDEQLSPTLRAADGRRITSLPKPNAKDDAALAAEARTQWKIAKTQIAQAARWLAARFEAAMVSGETWTWPEFDTNFRRHPLARHVVRRTLWIARTRGTSTCFRVAEDDTLADVNDATLHVDTACSVRPVHPFELNPDILDAWQHVLADYQIVSPFQQLDRPLFRVAPADASLQAVTAFPHARYEAKAIVFPLESRGWSREPLIDGGTIGCHSRTFAHLNLMAYVAYDPGAFVGDIAGSDTQQLSRLYFGPADRPFRRNEALRLGDVPPIVFSETLRDLHALVPAP